MPKFGKKSLERLGTCEKDLQRLMNEVIKRVDVTVLYGHRTREEQFELFRQGRDLVDGWWKVTDPKKVVTNFDGKVKKSKHNYLPAKAIDIAPYPIDWKNLNRFKDMAKIVIEEADKLGIKIIWGADWDMDGDIAEHKLQDYPHFELA